jgi:hypothetical protein
MRFRISLSIWGAVCIVALFVLHPGEVRSQDLINDYQNARFEQRVEELLEVLGRRVVPRSPSHIPSSADTVEQWIAQFEEEGPNPQAERTTRNIPELGTLAWEKISPAERGWFKRRYGDVEWTASGMRFDSPLDSISTGAIRAKLEALYGAPSNTIVDIVQDRQPRGAEYIQFEYWFVLNGSIPFIVLDVDGPFEEGLVFAGDIASQDILSEAKRALIEQIMNEENKSPYVDYYYSYDRSQWFVTGYDGEEQFVRQISRPNMSEGRPTVGSSEFVPAESVED